MTVSFANKQMITTKISTFLLFLCSVRDEGLSGFYKGLKPNLARVIPACGLTFVIYEEVSHFLLERRKQKELVQTSPTKSNDDDPNKSSK